MLKFEHYLPSELTLVHPAAPILFSWKICQHRSTLQQFCIMITHGLDLSLVSCWSRDINTVLWLAAHNDNTWSWPENQLCTSTYSSNALTPAIQAYWNGSFSMMDWTIENKTAIDCIQLWCYIWNMYGENLKITLKYIFSSIWCF